MKIFKLARLKLTAWYLLTIMLVSLSFSGVFYTMVNRELTRGLHRLEMSMKIPERRILPRRLDNFVEKKTPELVKELVLVRKRVIFNLAIINSFVFIFSGLAGYFLAGKTLQPIAEVLDDQKQFIANASHKLRTPLTALKTSTEVALRDKKLNFKKARSLIKSNLEEVNDLSLLTDRLLTLNQIQTKYNVIKFKRLNVVLVINKVIKKASSLAKQKNIKIKYLHENKKQSILGDKIALEQLIFVFLENAVKYTPKNGQIKIETRKNKKYLVIKIKDTGVGIAKKDLLHIFDRFYRSDNRVKGFGLGLFLAKEIINQHRGQISVKSKINQGTCFTIKLPA